MKLLKVNYRLANIRQNAFHHITSKIVKWKSIFIYVKYLNIKEILKNRHLSKAVQRQSFGEFRI